LTFGLGFVGGEIGSFSFCKKKMKWITIKEIQEEAFSFL